VFTLSLGEIYRVTLVNDAKPIREEGSESAMPWQVEIHRSNWSGGCQSIQYLGQPNL